MTSVLAGDKPLAPRSTADDADFDRFRADAYALLGTLLARPPSAELLAWLSALEVEESAHSALTEGWRALREAAEEASAHVVAEEYQALFIGLGKGEVVPYASWYKTGFLMERPLAELRADLRELGFEAEASAKEPEDHLGALCQVMALLAHPDEGYSPAEQARFFEAHVRGWVGRFFDDLRASPSARFYRAVAQFGTVFLDLESLRLEA